MGLPSFDSFSTAARHKVWRGDTLGLADGQVIGTGHAALDAQLPGGGWPVGAMTELLQAAPEAHAWQLLLPALAQAVQGGAGPVALIGAPQEPFGPALAAQGLPVEALLWVRSERDPLGGQRGHVPSAGAHVARLWACEQALRCAEVAAVLAWLPQARVGELRRLQLAAAQHERLLFVFRPDTAAHSASPARLRLRLAACPEDAAQIDVHILKRRGPPLAAPLQLPARSERMTALLAASQLRRKLRQQQEGGLPLKTEGATVLRLALHAEEGHALDRIALAA
jgi:protein ImuA